MPKYGKKSTLKIFFFSIRFYIKNFEIFSFLLIPNMSYFKVIWILLLVSLFDQIASSKIIDTSYKKSREILSFFHLLFDWPMANFGPLLRGQCHSPNANHYIYSDYIYFDWKVTRGPHNKIKLAKHLLGFELGTFQFICNALTHWATLSEIRFSGWFDL